VGPTRPGPTLRPQSSLTRSEGMAVLAVALTASNGSSTRSLFLTAASFVAEHSRMLARSMWVANDPCTPIGGDC